MSDTNFVKNFFRVGQVEQMLGLSRQTVKRLFDRGILTGHRSDFGQNRMISRRSLLKYAMQHKIVIPEIKMFPFAVVTIGLNAECQQAVTRAAGLHDAVVAVASSPMEFGVLVADGDKCCGVVDASVGMAMSCEIAKTIRKNDTTNAMLLIGVCGEDVLPTRMATSGFDTIYRYPFNPTTLCRRIGLAASAFREAVRT